MGFFSKFEGKMEDTFEGAAGKMNNAPISPVQIMKKAEKQMRREKMVSAGREFAPTLYTVLVNADDDQRLFGFRAKPKRASNRQRLPKVWPWIASRSCASSWTRA